MSIHDIRMAKRCHQNTGTPWTQNWTRKQVACHLSRCPEWTPLTIRSVYKHGGESSMGIRRCPPRRRLVTLNGNFQRAPPSHFISQYSYKCTSVLFHHCIIHQKLLFLLTPPLPLRAQHQGPSTSYTSFNPHNTSPLLQIPTSSTTLKDCFPTSWLEGCQLTCVMLQYYFSCCN